MARDESNPTLWAFGGEAPSLKGLTSWQEAQLGPHERLEAVWPWMVLLCKRTCNTLAARGQRISLEDLLQEVALAMVERDHKFDPAKGKYVTFFDAIFRNTLRRHLETRHAVVAPNNAISMLRKINKRVEAGTVRRSDQKHTLHALEAVLRGTVHFTEEPE